MRFNSIIFSLAALVLNTQVLGSNENSRLIKLNEQDKGKWINYDEVSKLIANSQHFVDITDDVQATSRSAPIPIIGTPVELPTDIRFWDEVRGGIKHLSKEKAKQQLTHLSSYHTRYFESATGVESTKWIYSQAEESVKKLGNNATISYFKHEWAQPSIIVRIPGKEFPDEVVVIGAHLDSINKTERATGRAPGADDDGTGTVSLLQGLNALAELKFQPKRTLEFQWYAAEEVGLRGSRAIAKHYRSLGINVISQLQLDMNGHLVNNQIRIVGDFTDPSLNALIKRFIEAYTVYYWVDGKCGYGCSDHASWNEQGYRAAFPLEDKATPYIHTQNDTVANVNFDHWYQFARVGLAYVIELSEPHNKITIEW